MLKQSNPNAIRAVAGSHQVGRPEPADFETLELLLRLAREICEATEKEEWTHVRRNARAVIALVEHEGLVPAKNGEHH